MVTPFFANYGFHPCFNISILGNSNNSSTKARTLANIHEVLSRKLILARGWYKAQAYRHHSATPTFAVGDQVWLLCCHINTIQPYGKFENKKLGPFRIIERMNPTPSLSGWNFLYIHNVFHASLYKPHHPSTIQPCEKLYYKKLGPFRIIERINPTPSLSHWNFLRMHNVFHASQRLIERINPTPSLSHWNFLRIHNVFHASLSVNLIIYPPILEDTLHLQ